jgi:hypothetical protein
MKFPFLIKLGSRRGGLSFGGGSNNSLRDTQNTINSGGGVPASPTDSVQFNSAGVFGGNAGFRYIPGTGILVGEDVKVYFNSNGGDDDSYIMFNSVTEYLELYVEGVVRAQF